jgi:hypothetical protein
MKKATDKTIQRRKLVLRSEAVTVLTPVQLTRVAGGWTQDWPCGGVSQQQNSCVTETVDR